MFAAANPVAPLIMLINNIIETTTNTQKILKQSRKTDYYGANDIGQWNTIFIILTCMGVITNTVMACLTSRQVE